MARSDKIFDLTDRTYAFARDVRKFVRRVPKDVCNIEDVKQLVKSSGSVGANYIEANEALSRKDFFYRIKFVEKSLKKLPIGYDYYIYLIRMNLKRFECT